MLRVTNREIAHPSISVVGARDGNEFWHHDTKGMREDNDTSLRHDISTFVVPSEENGRASLLDSSMVVAFFHFGAFGGHPQKLSTFTSLLKSIACRDGFCRRPPQDHYFEELPHTGSA